ncbi:MAG: peptidase M14 [Deltaproteobacteria bacterium]|nr:peptidase M14 [Deltaproteobacteria bacterium]
MIIFFLASACARGPGPASSVASLVTTAERSGYLRTGRYDEAVRLCRDFARVYAGVVCDELGRTVEDRPIVAVRVFRAAADAPVIYIQAGIHAGEIEGKDAGFWFVRDLLDGKVAPGVLAAVNIVFLPVMNPDGHERFGPNHRPNQRGPEEMGFRTTAARLNLNRDFVKADAPETRVVLELLARYRPVMMIDLHTTDGAKFEHDLSINVAPVAPRGDQLDETAQALSQTLVARLVALGHLPVAFYPSFVIEDDPASGFALGEAPPRFGHFYMAARSTLAVLVETHSWRTYKERTASTYHSLQAVFELAVKDAPRWRAVEREAAAADRALPGSEVTLIWQPGTHTRVLEFRGYAYERRPSEISGTTWITYDETRPQVWKIPLLDELVPAITVRIPRGGYVVDGGFAPVVAAALDRHHLRYTRLAGQPRVALEVFRATKVTYQPSFEGRTRVALEGAWQPETRTLDRGALFVPADQPDLRLIAHLFDPALPDSLVQWGALSAVFEQKEYMEAYVIEQVAREMIAKDPTLATAFQAALAADPELAKSPERRLAWFYKRHPAWDERVNLLPVYRTDRPVRLVQ